MEKRFKIAGIGTCLAIGGTIGAGILIQKGLEEKRKRDELNSRKRYVFRGNIVSNNQLSAEHDLEFQLKRVLQNKGAVNYVKCVKATQADDELFPEDYRFTLEVELETSLSENELRNAICSIEAFGENAILLEDDEYEYL